MPSPHHSGPVAQLQHAARQAHLLQRQERGTRAELRLQQGKYKDLLNHDKILKWELTHL